MNKKERHEIKIKVRESHNTNDLHTQDYCELCVDDTIKLCEESHTLQLNSVQAQAKKEMQKVRCALKLSMSETKKVESFYKKELEELKKHGRIPFCEVCTKKIKLESFEMCEDCMEKEIEAVCKAQQQRIDELISKVDRVKPGHWFIEELKSLKEEAKG